MDAMASSTAWAGEWGCPSSPAPRAAHCTSLPSLLQLTTARTHFHTLPPTAGFVYLLIALVSICYWIQGNTLKQEYEDAEREESALLGASSEKEEGQ